MGIHPFLISSHSGIINHGGAARPKIVKKHGKKTKGSPQIPGNEACEAPVILLAQ
jgi:hypothetical protein